MPYKDPQKRKEQKHRWWIKNRERLKGVHTEYMKEWSRKNPQKVKEYSRRYQQSHKEKLRKQYQQWAEKNRRRLFGYSLRAKYKITIEEYNCLFDKQAGCCAICDRHQSEFKKRLAVDHNHKTGKIRGLLCSTCNASLEIVENKEKLDKAIQYLARDKITTTKVAQ